MANVVQWNILSTTPEGCGQSEDCKEGLCGYNGAICVVTPEYCFRSQECKDIGVCAFDGYKCGKCRILHKSKAVKKRIVVLMANYLVNAKGCSESKRCQSHGTCGYQDAFGCMPTDMGCQNSSNCKEYGNCTKGYYGCIKK